MLELAISIAPAKAQKTSSDPQILELIYDINFGKQDQSKIRQKWNNQIRVCLVWVWQWSIRFISGQIA